MYYVYICMYAQSTIAASNVAAAIDARDRYAAVMDEVSLCETITDFSESLLASNDSVI